MKNFVNFETAYAALLSSKRAVNSISSRSISEYGMSDFQRGRRECVSGIDVALEVLRRWFKNHFPKTRLDAFHSDQFSFERFFELLKKYPELAQENEHALRSLLSDMRGGNYATMKIERIPDISEFIKN